MSLKQKSSARLFYDNAAPSLPASVSTVHNPLSSDKLSGKYVDACRRLPGIPTEYWKFKETKSVHDVLQAFHVPENHWAHFLTQKGTMANKKRMRMPGTFCALTDDELLKLCPEKKHGNIPGSSCKKCRA